MPIESDELSRRNLLRVLGIGGASALLFRGSPLFAQAAAAPATGDAAMQGGGFFNFALGEANVSVISDGGFVMKPGDIFPSVSKSELDRAVDEAHISDQGWPGQINCLLVKRGSDVILIDTGAGRGFGPTAGYLLTNLSRAGVAPADVTHVILSHAHPDHVGGILTAEGRPTFTRAKVYANRDEHDFWTGADPQIPGSALPADFVKQVISTAKSAFAGVKGSLELVKPDDTIAGVVKVVEAYGHTPGHVALRVGTGDGPHLMFLGDAIFILPLNLRHPEWHAIYDSDPAAAAATRRRLLEQVAKDKSLASSAHMPFPAAGYVDEDASAFRWTPRPWTWG